MGPSDLELLRQYASDKSEDAFTGLVHRHLGLVYGVAFRIVRDRAIAEEVAQSVFMELGQNISGPARAVEIAADAVGDDILERYRIVAHGYLNDLHPEEPVIVETGPVDNEFDTLLKLGHHWLSVSSINDSTP